jgi:hypothetical protein
LLSWEFCLNNFLNEPGGLEAGEPHNIGGSLLRGVEGIVDRSGNLQGAGDEFGAEEGGVVGSGVDVERFELVDACADRLKKVVGDFLAFDRLQPELEFGDLVRGEWRFEGSPPGFAGVVDEAIVEPLELYADDAFACADAGKTAIDVGFCDEDGVFGESLGVGGVGDGDVDVDGLGGEFDDI